MRPDSNFAHVISAFCSWCSLSTRGFLRCVARQAACVIRSVNPHPQSPLPDSAPPRRGCRRTRIHAFPSTNRTPSSVRRRAAARESFGIVRSPQWRSAWLLILRAPCIRIRLLMLSLFLSSFLFHLSLCLFEDRKSTRLNSSHLGI